MFDFLCGQLKSAVYKLDIKLLREIRIRLGEHIKILYKGEYFYLSNFGATKFFSEGIVATEKIIEDIIFNLTEGSIYAFNDRIKEGFLTTKDGVRVGISGECVFNGDKIITIKNITSLNIRVANNVLGCGEKIVNKILMNNNIYNSLIISLPGCGKTTLLKDICRILNGKNCGNILVIDERGELNCKGENIDIIKYSNKNYAFNFAIRSLAPNIVITDELMCESDFNCIKNIVYSGINVIATMHGNDIFELKNKGFFINGLFDRYFVLCGINTPGIIEKVYDKDFNLVN